MKNLKNEHGFTLIEIMIAVGIGITLMLGFMSMMNAQNRMAKVVAQKIEMLTLKQTLLSMTNNPTLCACNFDRTQNTSMAAQLAINGTTATPPDIELSQLRSSCDMTATANNFIAQEGQILAGSQTNIKVSTLKLTNIRPVNGTTDEFSGTLEAHMDSSSFTMALQPISIPIMMNTDPGVPANYATLRIQACSGLGSGANDTPAIVCSKNSGAFNGANGVTAAQVFNISFTANDCSPHTLPDASYVGSFSKMYACGETDSWRVLQPYEGSPGFSVWIGPPSTVPNNQTCPTGQPAVAPHIEVVFVKRSAQ